MKRNAWIAFSAVSAVLALAVALVSGLKGGCPSMVETAMGGQMPMKCHWTFYAVALMGAGGFFAGLLAALSTETQARRMTACLSGVAFLLVLLAVNVVMGTCSGEGHPCGQTALIVNVLSVIGFVVDIVLVARAKEDRRPKARL